MIPSSLQLVCIDIDEGGKQGIEVIERLLGPPVTVTRTRRKDGYHVWYRIPKDAVVGNRKWRCVDASGDVRGSRGFAILWRGFAILWDAKKLADRLHHGFDDAKPVDLAALTNQAATSRGVEAVRQAPEGARNDTLNREAFVAAKNGHLDPEEFRKAARAAGLPDSEISSTLASAAKAGKRDRAKKNRHASSRFRAKICCDTWPKSSVLSQTRQVDGLDGGRRVGGGSATSW